MIRKIIDKILGRNKLNFDEENKELYDIQTEFQFAGHTFKVINPFSNKFLLTTRNRYFTDMYEIEMGFLKEDLLAFMKAGIGVSEYPTEYSNDKELIKILSDKLADVKTLMTQVYLVGKEQYQYKPFLKSAAILIMMDEEKPSDDYMMTLDKKMELCERYPEIEGFFLTVSNILIYRLRNKDDIIKHLEYLEATKRGQKIAEKTLYSIAGQSMYYSTGQESETKQS